MPGFGHTVYAHERQLSVTMRTQELMLQTKYSLYGVELLWQSLERGGGLEGGDILPPSEDGVGRFIFRLSCVLLFLRWIQLFSCISILSTKTRLYVR